MTKNNRTVDRRRFLATCGASLGVALISRPWRKSLAEEIGRDEHKISDLEVVRSEPADGDIVFDEVEGDIELEPLRSTIN